MEPMAISMLLAIGTLTSVMIMQFILTKNGGVGANRLIGLKTRETVKSDEAWNSGHKAAQYVLLTGAVVGPLLMAIIIILGITSVENNSVTYISVTGFFVMLSVLFYASFVANKAAKKINKKVQ